MRRLILPLALVATAAAGLSACGQKGDLYFPPPPAAAAAVKPQPGAQPAHATTTAGSPAPASSTRSPFNPVIHQ
ncbi:MAG: lipoprotein [Luteibacter sp.]